MYHINIYNQFKMNWYHYRNPKYDFLNWRFEALRKSLPENHLSSGIIFCDLHILLYNSPRSTISAVAKLIQYRPRSPPPHAAYVQGTDAIRYYTHPCTSPCTLRYNPLLLSILRSLVSLCIAQNTRLQVSIENEMGVVSFKNPCKSSLGKGEINEFAWEWMSEWKWRRKDWLEVCGRWAYSTEISSFALCMADVCWTEFMNAAFCSLREADIEMEDVGMLGWVVWRGGYVWFKRSLWCI